MINEKWGFFVKILKKCQNEVRQFYVKNSVQILQQIMYVCKQDLFKKISLFKF